MIATNTPPPTSTPIRASSHGTAPVPRLASTPATIPGRVIAFGMIWSWRSIAVIAMSAARRAAATTKRAVGPNAAYADRNAAPVTASTTGYRQEIGSADARQRPPRSANDRSGRWSDQHVPGLGRTELGLDLMAELPKRLGGSSELEEDVPQGRVRRDVLGRESYRRLNRRERLVGLVRFHERRRQVVDGVGVVRVLPEVDPVAVDRVLEVAGPRVDEAHVIVLLN